jgi:hypothetical protein
LRIAESDQMISTLRTYRSLRIVAALTLLLSAGLPLVRYVCAQPGQVSRSISLAFTAPSSSCAYMPAGVHTRLCKEGSLEASSPEDCPEATTCTAETNAQEPAVTASTATAQQQLAPAQASFLAALTAAFARSAPSTDTLLFFFRVRENRPPWSSAGVPVRLVTSTFLL